MAIQLTRRRLGEFFRQSDQQFHVSARVLTIGCFLVVGVSFAAIIAGIAGARREEEAAVQRYTDAEALLALPSIDTSKLEAELDAARIALPTAEALLAPPAIDPSSDEATALLVEHAHAASLVVLSMDRTPASQAKVDDVSYEVEVLRLGVEGDALQIATFLGLLHQASPSLIPSLEDMTIQDGDEARAQLTFRIHTEVSAEGAPAPGEVAP